MKTITHNAVSAQSAAKISSDYEQFLYSCILALEMDAEDQGFKALAAHAKTLGKSIPAKKRATEDEYPLVNEMPEIMNALFNISRMDVRDRTEFLTIFRGLLRTFCH